MGVRKVAAILLIIVVIASNMSSSGQEQSLSINPIGSEGFPLMMYEGDSRMVTVSNPSTPREVVADKSGDILIFPTLSRFAGDGYFTVICPEAAKGGIITFSAQTGGEDLLNPVTLVIACGKRTLRAMEIGPREPDFSTILEMQIDVGKAKQVKVLFSLPPQRPNTEVSVNTDTAMSRTTFINNPDEKVARRENIIFRVLPESNKLSQGRNEIEAPFTITCFNTGQGSFMLEDTTSIVKGITYTRYDPAIVKVQCGQAAE